MRTTRDFSILGDMRKTGKKVWRRGYLDGMLLFLCCNPGQVRVQNTTATVAHQHLPLARRLQSQYHHLHAKGLKTRTIQVIVEMTRYMG